MLSGISPLSVLLILLIVVLLFGTKKLRNLGGDMGAAIRSFKKAVKDENSEAGDKPKPSEKTSLERDNKSD